MNIITKTWSHVPIHICHSCKRIDFDLLERTDDQIKLKCKHCGSVLTLVLNELPKDDPKMWGRKTMIVIIDTVSGEDIRTTRAELESVFCHMQAMEAADVGYITEHLPYKTASSLSTRELIRLVEDYKLPVNNKRNLLRTGFV